MDTFFIREKKDTLQLIDHNVLPFTNRGYAANCRVKRLDEMSELEQEFMALDEDYAAAYEEVLRKKALILKQQEIEGALNFDLQEVARKRGKRPYDLARFEDSDYDGEPSSDDDKDEVIGLKVKVKRPEVQ